jgi:hypothetical protein
MMRLSAQDNIRLVVGLTKDNPVQHERWRKSPN